MITYLLQVAICWGLFLGLYHLTLRKETFFIVNRVYLLLTIVLGLLIPRVTWDTTMFMEQPTVSVAIDYMTLGFEQMTSVVAPTVAEADNSMGLLAMIYWIGVLFMIGKLIYGIGKILWMRRSAQLTKEGDQVIAYTQRDHAPFTFFGTIYLGFDYAQPPVNSDSQGSSFDSSDTIGFGRRQSAQSPPLSREELKDTSNEEHLEQAERSRVEDTSYETNSEQAERSRSLILIHESAHVSGWHTLDVLFIELVKAFFWFNPLAYGYDHALKTVHEYIADANVLQQTALQRYGRLLLRQAQPGLEIALANHFYNHQLKKRFNMMTRTPSQKRMLLKYLSVLPFILVVSLVFSNQQVQAEISKVEEIDLVDIFQSNKIESQVDNLLEIFINQKFDLLLAKYVVIADDIHTLVNDLTKEESEIFINHFNQKSNELSLSISAKNDDDIIWIGFLGENSQYTYYPIHELKDITSDPSGTVIMFNRKSITFSQESNSDENDLIINPIDLVRRYKASTGETSWHKYAEINDDLQRIINTKTVDQQKTLAVEINRYAKQLRADLKAQVLENGQFGIGFKKDNKVDYIYLPVTLKQQIEKTKIDSFPPTHTPDGLEILNIAPYGDENKIKTKTEKVKYYNLKDQSTQYRMVTMSVDHDISKDTMISYDQNTLEEIMEVTTPPKSKVVEVFKVVEEMPLFPGGKEALNKYIQDNQKHRRTETAKAEGTAIAEFVIDKNGELLYPKVDIGPDLPTRIAALDLISKMRDEIKWTPGKQRGKEVRVSMSLPITFSLSSDYSVPQEEVIKRYSTGTPFIDDRGIKVRMDTQFTYYPERFEEEIVIMHNELSQDQSSTDPNNIIPAIFNTSKDNGTLILNTDRTLKFEVYNRWGNQVYRSSTYKNDWDGSWKGKQLPEATYFALATHDDGSHSSDWIRLISRAQQNESVSLLKKHTIDSITVLNPDDYYIRDTIIDFDPDNYEETVSIKKKLISGSNEKFKVVDQKPYLSCDSYQPNATAEEIQKCGQQRLFKWIFSQLKYPKNAMAKGIQGNSVIRMIIEKDGKVSDTKIVRDPGAGLGGEALRVINLMNDELTWNPGIKDGKVVRTVYNIPIRFKLDPKKEENKNPLIVIFDDKGKTFFNIEGIRSEDAISPDDIERINVLKGEKAIDQYGGTAKNGVIEIYMKPGKIDLPEQIKEKKKVQDQAGMDFEEVNIFPNPASDELVIAFKGLGQATTLLIHSIDGKVLLQKELIGNGIKADLTTTHNIGNLPIGILIVSLTQGDKVYSKPIIKK